MRVTQAFTLLATLLVSAVVAAGCGSGSEGDGGQAVDVEFTRADGSVAEFPAAIRAWCGPFDETNPDVEAVHLLAGERAQDETPEPFWTLIAVRGDVEREPTVALPAGFVYEEPRGAILFALDDAEHGNNELSSGDEDSDGEIRVEVSGCEVGDTVNVTFDGVVLGSEAHGSPSVSVEGTVVAEIGAAP